VEAGVHHYQATGKLNLLSIAVKMANYMCDTMGPAPRKNIVPAHSLPEEAFVELYLVFKNDPSLRAQLKMPIHEDDYLSLAEFWLESRGRHAGRPTTEEWEKNEPESQRWVREQKYGDQRPCWGAYAQDHVPVFQQETIEGHAVRAVLMCAGLSAAARVNGRTDYSAAASRLWDNMVGRRMHITGGAGAFAHEEKFGPDYVLPNDAYLETCAAVGAGFFHRNMNLLFGHARYADELERVLYNNVLNGVSLGGNRYFYQNPLSAKENHRWEWHGCPCCPPMFLKIVSALPGYIYAYDREGIYVNLFIGSTAEFTFNEVPVKVIQKTDYPWKGDISITVEPEKEMELAVKIRIPGWAAETENPFGLYKSDLQSSTVLKVNGEKVSVSETLRGYAVIQRKWKQGDTIQLELPMQPRRIYANPQVKANSGKVALQSGPLVYCFEEKDNSGLARYVLKSEGSVRLDYQPELFGGVNTIKAEASIVLGQGTAAEATLTAIPFYCQDNRDGGGTIEVWMTEQP